MVGLMRAAWLPGPLCKLTQPDGDGMELSVFF